MNELVLSGCSMVADYVTYMNLSAGPYVGYDPIKDKAQVVEWERMTPFQTLPYKLGEHYNLDAVDLAKPGISNQQIFDTLVDYIHTHHARIDMVFACWTELTRIAVGPNTIVFRDYEPNESNDHYLRMQPNNAYDTWHALRRSNAISKQDDLDNFYRCVVTLDQLCKSYDITCIQSLSIIPKCLRNDFAFAEMLINHKRFSRVESLKFYGWPCWAALKGKALCEWPIAERLKYQIVENDYHFNERGHEKMKDILVDYISERQHLGVHIQ